MNIILHIIKKEFLQFRRDKKMLGISFFAPVFQLIMVGYATNLDVSDIPTVVCDMDNTSKSRELLSDFKNSGYFNFKAFVDNINDVDCFIDRGKASIAIVIPTVASIPTAAMPTPYRLAK